VTTHANAFALHWQAALARPAWHLPEDFQTRLVIFGAGGLGRKIARVLSNMGHTPLAFCDNNPHLWNTEINGIKVLSVNDAIAAFPAAVFMIAIWHPSRTEGLKRRAATLRQLGCKEVTCFIPLFWNYFSRICSGRYPKDLLVGNPRLSLVAIFSIRLGRRSLTANCTFTFPATLLFCSIRLQAINISPAT
jgi:hypothetical protein